MNIYSDGRGRCIWQNVLLRAFSESFVTFCGHPQPPFGDYFLLICITGGTLDKRSESPTVAL